METPSSPGFIEFNDENVNTALSKNAAESSAFHFQLEAGKLDQQQKLLLARATAAAGPAPIANPGPLGLCAFALTTFVLSLYNAEAFGIKIHNMIVSLAIFYGGAVQILAGMWEFRANNLFGATAFSSYGAFWMALGYINIPGSGIGAAYSGHTDELKDALGVFLLGWTIFTLVMLVATLRKTIAMVVLFSLLEVTFVLLTIGNIVDSPNTIKAAGWFGVLTAFGAWYNAFAAIVASDKDLSELITVPVGPLTRPKISDETKA